MPRRSMFLSDTPYYLTNSSPYRLFQTSRDYELFLEYMLIAQVEYPEVRLLAYCLLPSQIHFVVQPLLTGHEISEWMRKIQVSYAMYCKKTKSDLFPLKSSPFPSRFEAKRYDTIETQRIILKEINNLPLSTGLVTHLKDRPYTSAHQYYNTGYKDSSKTHLNVFAHGIL